MWLLHATVKYTNRPVQFKNTERRIFGRTLALARAYVVSVACSIDVVCLFYCRVRCVRRVHVYVHALRADGMKIFATAIRIVLCVFFTQIYTLYGLVHVHGVLVCPFVGWLA